MVVIGFVLDFEWELERMGGMFIIYLFFCFLLMFFGFVFRYNQVSIFLNVIVLEEIGLVDFIDYEVQYYFIVLEQIVFYLDFIFLRDVFKVIQ